MNKAVTELQTMDEPRQQETTYHRVIRVVRAELAMYPGRASLIGRIVLACTLSMIVIMVFRMPGAALGAYYPLLLSRDNPRSTLRAALRTSLVCVLGTAGIILGAMLFIGSPFLHLVWVAVSLFAVFYVISSMRPYDAALALGLIVATGISTWDLPLSPDTRLTLTLFTMLSILIGCAIAVAVEYVFAHTHSPDVVLDGIRQRLALVRNLIQGLSEGSADLYRIRTQLSALATKGTGQLRERLSQANYDTRYRARLAAALALSDRLVDVASRIEHLDPRSANVDRARCVTIVANIAGIDAHLAREEAPDFIPVPAVGHSYTPLLIEVERNVDLLAQSLTDEEHPAHYHLPEPGEDRRFSLFCADAFTSKEHVRFAVRGTLSALACYLVYMSVGWTGLGASTATCVLTALTNTGASRHKQLLRFAGVILGACVIGFGTQALILPNIDSLFAFAILFALVTSLGAWVGTSGPRIAYAGAQIVLAYDLVNLNRFTITTSLVPARDTVLGIMLGILAMWLIFDHLWPCPSIVSMRKLFLAIFREIARFGPCPEPLPSSVQSSRLLAESEGINARLDSIRTLTDYSVFEPYSRTGDDTWIIECVKTLQPQLRYFLLLKTGLLQHELISEPCEGDDLACSVRQRASAMLLESAQVIETGTQPSAEEHDSLPDLLAVVSATVARAREENNAALLTHMMLNASLLDVACHIRADALTLSASRRQTVLPAMPVHSSYSRQSAG